MIERWQIDYDTKPLHSVPGSKLPANVVRGANTYPIAPNGDMNCPTLALTIARFVESAYMQHFGQPSYKSRILRFFLLLVLSLAVQGGNLPARAQGDSQPPTVIVESPFPGAYGQAVNSNVTATFSEAIQPASVAFVLRDSANTIVPANLSYDAATHTVTLHPNADLLASRTYTATVSGAMDLAGNTMSSPAVWSFSTGQPGFQESVIFSGLDSPTAFQFASDGRVFVAQKSGLIVVFNSLNASTSTVFADLRTNVHNFGNRGLLGLALDPSFPTVPYVYVFYTYDAPIGGLAPTWGAPGASADMCSAPSGACVVSGRISRLQANGNVMTGTEQVLVEDWYQQYPGQSVGNLAFGPDGALYASAGDGASSSFVDLGQTDSASPDPPNEGGALRSQDLRTPADPVTLDGSIIRIHPDTGLPVRENTSMTVGTPTVDANGVKSYLVTSTFQGSQPLTVRVLEPTNPPLGKPRRFLYVLPVEAGVTNLSSNWSDGLEELRLLDVPNRFNLTLIAPSFNYEPWYGDNSTDPTLWMESFIIRDLVPFGDTFAQGTDIPQRFLIGFSKSGNGVLFLILRHPNVFSAAAAWDAPAQLSDLTAFNYLSMNFGTQTNYNLYNIPSLVLTNAQPFTKQNRLWISGDVAAWTADMIALHNQLTAASILHTWVQGGTRVHSWSSGWLNGAVTALDANATATAPVDNNEQRVIAYGLRSPRLTFRPGTQEIWVADNGWNSTEEINRIPNTTNGIVENFGWPCYEGSATTSYSGSSICSLLYSQLAATTAPYYSYDHQQKVVPGDEGGVGSGAISGLAFYDTGSYPANYQGALFFSDYLRNNIWVMFHGSNGLPDPTNRANFLLGAASPVDLKTGPGGDLFYADLNGGTIRRIAYLRPVVRSNGQPVGSLTAGTTQTMVSLATDQNASCRYATSVGVAYGSMPNTFANTGGTVHSTLVTGLVDGGNYNFYVRCEDVRGNTNSDDFPISFSVAKLGDTTPPVRTNGQPTGVLASGTSQTSLSLTTDENATCRYAATVGVAYGSMPSVFSSTGSTTHSTTVTGLVNGGSYSYYVRCQDSSGNANVDDFVVTFSVAGGSAGGNPVTSSFSGTENPLSENGMWDKPGAWTSLKKNNGAYSTDLLSSARLVTPVVGADQYAEITYDQDPGSSSWVGVTTRVQGTANGSGYLAIAYAGQVRLYRTDDTGSLNFTLLASANAVIGTAPRDLRMESQGANHRVYFNGVLAISYTASGTAYTTGQPGIAASVFGGPTVKILSFVGGALVGGSADTTPPVRTNGQPTGVLASGTSQTSLSLTTDENATCRYAATVGVAYGSMPSVFSSTGSTTHSTTVTGLVNGGSYSYYVRCQDSSGNANVDDFVVTFSVAGGSAGGNPVTSSFSGTENPLSENGMWDKPGAWTSLKKNNGAYSTDLLSSARLVTPVVGADQYAEITYDQDPGSSSWVGVTTRVQGTANGSGYLAIAYAGQVRLYRTDDTGSLNFTLLASANAVIGTAPRDLRMESQGANHRVYFNGVLAISYTASGTAYTTGQPGIAASVFGGPTVKILSFVGGALQTVNQAPAISSANSATFTVGTAGSFTVTTTGAPTPSVTGTGTLPSGVTFRDNGNGTATLSGTPASGSGGTYSLTITANNGVGPAANQTFTLTVNAAQTAPAISSANSTTFTVGTAGSFTVTTTGAPTPSVTGTGTLPSGVTFRDNGNGTATLSGTPASGSGGTYSLTITANNGVGPLPTRPSL